MLHSFVNFLQQVFGYSLWLSESCICIFSCLIFPFYFNNGFQGKEMDNCLPMRWSYFITKTLEECLWTRMMIVHWVRKVCSRELTLLLVFMMFYSVFYILVGVKSCSFHSFVVIESMSLVVEFGSLEIHTSMWQRYGSSLFDNWFTFNLL